MIEIIPSILTSDLKEFKDLMSKAERGAKRAHIDIIDGVYANNKTIQPLSLEDFQTDLSLDFHLMVDEPINWVERCIRAGADRIIGHIEMMSDWRAFVVKVVEAGVSPGLAIDIGSDPKEIPGDILESLEVITVMSVPAGFGGQEFHSEALDKIEYLNKIRQENNYSYLISDDGGITFEKIEDLSNAGVDEVIIGRRLFEGDIRENVAKLEKQVKI